MTEIEKINTENALRITNEWLSVLIPYEAPYFGSGEMEAIKSALEKQIPKKAKYSEYDDNGDGEIIPYKAECPICGYEFEFGTFNESDNHHCPCGQALKWD